VGVICRDIKPELPEHKQMGWFWGGGGWGGWGGGGVWSGHALGGVRPCEKTSGNLGL